MRFSLSLPIKSPQRSSHQDRGSSTVWLMLQARCACTRIILVVPH